MSKRLSLAFTIILGLSGAAVRAQSADPLNGTWRMNLAKSTYSPGPKPTFAATMKVEASNEGIKMTIDNVDASGQLRHEESAGQFDGKQYPVKGAPNANTTMGYTRIDRRTYLMTVQVNDETVATYKAVISADGKTWTATQSGKDAQGHPVSNTIVLDKQ